jgi:hypothetical protein
MEAIMETIKVKDSRVYSLVALYDLHTGFFSKAIDGISDDDAHNRLNTKANHIAWLTGSLVEQRYEMGRHLGIEKKQAGNEFFKDNKGIQNGTRYPALADFTKDWDAINAELRNAFVNTSAEQFDKSIDMGGMKMTLYELVTFIIYREANIIGQIALWRRLLGYEAMKYM